MMMKTRWILVLAAVAGLNLGLVWSAWATQSQFDPKAGGAGAPTQDAWSQTENLSQNSSESLYPKMATDAGGSVHIVWQDTVLGNADVLYRRWNGIAWLPTVNLSQNDDSSENPAIAAGSSGQLHVAWSDSIHRGNHEIFYRRWNGADWSPMQNLSLTGGTSAYAALAAGPQGSVHLAWSDNTSGNYDIMYRRWDGADWSPTENLSQNSGESSEPAVAADSSGNAHVVWRDSTTTNPEILYRRWNGSAWSATENVSQTGGSSWAPSVATDGAGKVHVAWADATPAGYEIMHRIWNGADWSPTENLSENTGASSTPALAADAAGNVHVVWFDNTSGNNEILRRSWSAGGWTGVENLSQNVGDSSYPVVAAGVGGNVSIAWTDDTTGNPEILYRVRSLAAPSPAPTPTATVAPASTPTATPANSIQLAEGWNLVSIPGPQQDPSLSALFGGTAAVTKVYTSIDGAWVFANRGATGWAGPLTSIEDGKGYYILATSPASVTLSPKPPDPAAPPPAYSFPAGWSLIGFTSSVAAKPVATYLASLEGKWSSLFRYDPAGGWGLAKPGGVGFQDVERGRGYWILLAEPGRLTP